jgi:hypothetical protein
MKEMLSPLRLNELFDSISMKGAENIPFATKNILN